MVLGFLPLVSAAVTLTWQDSANPPGITTYSVYRIIGDCTGTLTWAAPLVTGLTVKTYVDNPGIGPWCYGVSAVVTVAGKTYESAKATGTITVPPATPTNLTITGWLLDTSIGPLCFSDIRPHFVEVKATPTRQGPTGVEMADFPKPQSYLRVAANSCECSMPPGRPGGVFYDRGIAQNCLVWYDAGSKPHFSCGPCIKA